MPDDKYTLDEIRNKIKSYNLSKEERDLLIDRFKKAGGKIIKETKIGEVKVEKNTTHLSREVEPKIQTQIYESKIPNSKIESNYNDNKIGNVYSKENLNVKNLYKNLKADEVDAKDFFSLLSIRFEAFNYGITGYFGKKINIAFMIKLTSELRFILHSFKIYVQNILEIDKELNGAILKELKNQDPEFLGILQQSVDFLTKDELLFLTKINYSEEVLYYENIKDVVLSITRKIYHLKLNYNRFILLLNVINGIILKSNSKLKNDFNLFHNKAYIAWKKLMGSSFNRIIMLIQRLELKKLRPGSIYFEKIIKYELPAPTSVSA